jgi:hypothetical protein
MTEPSNSNPEFAAVADLIALIVSPKDCAARLAELQKQIATTAKAQAKFDSEKATHDRAASAAEADMIAREQAIRKREVDVAIRERDLAAREQALIAKLNESRPARFEFDPNMGPGAMSHSGLTREPE